MFHYFLPMLVDEFNNLLRLGNMQVPPGRWLYARPGKPNDADQSSFVDEIREITPSFEDTISIVIVEFSTCIPSKPKRHSLYEFSFTDAVATYALTHHDRDVLSSRLGSVAKLSKELLIDEKFVQLWKKELSEIRSLQGAQSLLTIYQTGNNQFSNHKLLIQDELLKALDLRRQYLDSPINGGSYLDNLICYSRLGTIPNNDAGFFYYTICILEYYLARKSSRNKAEHYHKQNFLFIPMVNDLIDTGDARKFDGYVDLPGALVSSLVFLKLSHEIREHNQSLNREWLRKLLNPIHDQASVARGVWWCGGFWSFTQLAEEYYAIAPLQENLESRLPGPAVVCVPAVIQPGAPTPEPSFAEPILAVPTKPAEPVKPEPARPLAEERVSEVMESVSESRAVAVAPIPSLLAADGVAPLAQAPDVSATPTDSPDTGLQVASGAEETIEVEAAPIPDAPPGVPATAPRPEPTSPSPKTRKTRAARSAGSAHSSLTGGSR